MCLCEPADGMDPCDRIYGGLYAQRDGRLCPEVMEESVEPVESSEDMEEFFGPVEMWEESSA